MIPATLDFSKINITGFPEGGKTGEGERERGGIRNEELGISSHHPNSEFGIRNFHRTIAASQLPTCGYVRVLTPGGTACGGGAWLPQ